MRKTFIVAMFCLSAVSVQASGPGDLGIPIVLTTAQVYGVDPTLGQNPPIKLPVHVPEVYLDGHTLSFVSTYAEPILVQLVDSRGEEACATWLPVGSTQVSLPSSLSGDYTLFIYIGSLCFTGNLSL